jgi:thioredoxin reductase (NADPH)
MTTIPLPQAPGPCIRDCVVIGAGPAGTMAALYLQRFCRDVVVIDAGSSRTRYIDSSRNCPGFPYGIGGKELLERLRQQADTHGVEVVNDRVIRVRLAPDGRFAVDSASDTWLARSVIIATGVVDRLPRWPQVENAIHQGLVRLCAVCDAYEAEDKRIAVYGTAADGVGHAAFLRTFSTRVSLVLPPGARLAPDARAQAAALGITLLHAPEDKCSLADGAFCVETADGVRHLHDRVYISLGAAAQTSMVDGVGVLMVEEGEVQVDDKCETSVAGIYAIGDAVSALNQIGVAFGHAAIAATAIHNRLERNPRREGPR